MKRLLMFIFTVTFITNCFAAIYVREEGGLVTYSDRPLENGKKLETVPQVNTLTTDAAQKPTEPLPLKTKSEKSTKTPAQVTEPEGTSYTTFMITSPKDEQTFQNQPSIPVNIVIQPELKKGDRILLMMDNKPYGTPVSTTELSLQMVERGTHQIAAVVMNERQQILKQSNTVTIFVHRSNLNSPARRNQTSNAVKPTTIFTMLKSFF